MNQVWSKPVGGAIAGQTHLNFLDKLWLMCIGLKEGDRDGEN